MDSWFVELFNIISKQKETKKVDRLLPEIFSEFDILTRAQNKAQLEEIYKYLVENNPICTDNPSYNEEAHIKCQKEVIKKFIILDDFSILDRKIKFYLDNDDKKGLDDYINSWSDFLLIQSYISEAVKRKELKVDPIPVVEDYSPSTISKPKPKIKIEKPKFDEYDREKFFDFVEASVKKYNLVINQETLNNLDNPKPAFFRIFLEQIESKELNASFFIDLYDIAEKYDSTDFFTFIVSKSKNLKKICALNAGLLNEDDLDSKLNLMDKLKSYDEDYLNVSRAEIELRLYIDSLNSSDNIVIDLQNRCKEISEIAPKSIDISQVLNHFNFFKNNIIDEDRSVIMIDNVVHLYWSYIFNIALSLYVKREKAVEFIENINYLSNISNFMSLLVEDSILKESIKTLTKYYINSIYKECTYLSDYESLWDRQRDDLLEAKRNALNQLK